MPRTTPNCAPLANLPSDRESATQVPLPRESNGSSSARNRAAARREVAATHGFFSLITFKCRWRPSEWFRPGPGIQLPKATAGERSLMDVASAAAPAPPAVHERTMPEGNEGTGGPPPVAAATCAPPHRRRSARPDRSAPCPRPAHPGAWLHTADWYRRGRYDATIREERGPTCLTRPPTVRSSS